MPEQRFEVMDEYSAPVRVYLYLTQQCNMRCSYCSAEAVAPRSSQNEELTDEEMISLAEQLTTAKIFFYTLTGGEPFLRRELLFSILERIAPTANVSLLTNGTMITADDGRRLANFKNRHLDVVLSIDAATEEINAVTRGRGFLADALRGGRRLMEQGLEPSVNCVVSRSNCQCMPDFVEFLKKEGYKRLQISPLRPLGYARDSDSLTLSARERLQFSREIVELATREKELRIRVKYDLMWLNLVENRLSYLKKRDEYDRKPAMLLSCGAGVNECSITADGWVTPCHSMLSCRCGNVRQQDFISIWRNSPQLEEVRALRRMPVTEVSECADCQYNFVCNGGCRALGLVNDGSLLSVDPMCTYLRSS